MDSIVINSESYSPEMIKKMPVMSNNAASGSASSSWSVQVNWQILRLRIVCGLIEALIWFLFGWAILSLFLLIPTFEEILPPGFSRTVPNTHCSRGSHNFAWRISGRKTKSTPSK
jgi:hypothetical protein